MRESFLPINSSFFTINSRIILSSLSNNISNYFVPKRNEVFIMNRKTGMQSYSNIILKYLFLFLVGGFTYFYLEILFRERSHFSMILCGGLAFVLCGALNQWSHFRISVVSQMILSALIITILEFVTGYIINIKLHWNVWDYSSLPYNLLGQICVAYSAIWLLLSLVCIFVDDWIRWKIFDEEKPKYVWW